MQHSYKVGTRSFHFLIGDITDLQVEAIVNAANEFLIMGGGVAGAILEKGGPEIQKECNMIGGTFVGGAVITGAGNLKADYVIHAAGPIKGEGDEDNKLANSVRNSLRLTAEHQIKNIAFPAISAGIFSFPVERCAQIMIRECISFSSDKSPLEDIYFCLWNKQIYEVFVKEMEIQLKPKL